MRKKYVVRLIETKRVLVECWVYAEALRALVAAKAKGERVELVPRWVY